MTECKITEDAGGITEREAEKTGAKGGREHGVAAELNELYFEIGRNT